MFRESIRIKCGRVGYLLHTEPRGKFSSSRKLIVVWFITQALATSWEASSIQVTVRGGGT